MTTLEALGISRMSVAQRIALAQEILDTVAADQPSQSLSDAKRRELDRRLADSIANPDEGVPWEQVEAATLSRFGQ